MSEVFLGQVSMFGFNFAPRGYALCNGQLLPINQNQALFSLLGTTYGGNGVQTFALPNLQSSTPIAAGSGPGLTPRVLGETGGVENVTLTLAQLPAHTHPLQGTAAPATVGTAAGNTVPATPTHVPIYRAAGANSTSMSLKTVGLAGGNLPHSNIQPCLTINFCIALQGIFPSRN